MQGYKKLDEKVDYEILNCVALVNCVCGNDIYLDYFMADECDVCGRIYDITGLTVSEYEKEEK